MARINLFHATMSWRGTCGAMDNASDYGSEDSRFESWQVRMFFFTTHIWCNIHAHSTLPIDCWKYKLNDDTILALHVLVLM